MLNVIRPGARIEVADEVEGVVTDVMISGETDIQYKVSWWSGRSRNHEWFQATELQQVSCDRMKIGFHE